MFECECIDGDVIHNEGDWVIIRCEHNNIFCITQEGEKIEI